ncbi:MAG: hypothetical protein Q8934_19740 [Bacillota bacterium]|nr:hypothetical protein [Bacillota bacterium]
MANNFDVNKLNQIFDQQFGQGSFNAGIQQAANAAKLKKMAGFAKSDALSRIKALQAKAKKDQEYMDKYGMTYDAYQAKKEQDKLNKLQDKYQVLDNGLTSDQAQKMRDKAESQGRGGHQPSYDQQRKEAQQSAKNSSDLTSYDTSKMTPHNQELVNQLMQNSKKKDSSNNQSWKDKLGELYTNLNTAGERVGNQFIRTVFGDNAANWNMQQDLALAQNELFQNPNNKVAQRALKSNLAATAPAKTIGQKALNYTGGTVGTVAPFLVGDGLLGVGEKALGAVTKGAAKKVLTSAVNPSKLVNNSLGKLALQGATSGLVGSGVNMTAHNVMSGEQYTPQQIAANLALNGALGAAVPPALKGLAQNLNLKGQVGKLYGDLGSVPFNPVRLENAMKEAFPTKTVTPEQPNLLLSLGGTNKAETVPAQASIPTSNQALAPTERIKLKTVKTPKDINEMSLPEIEDIWHQLHDRQQQLIDQNADPIHLKAINEDINNVSNLLVKLDLQQFGAPQPHLVTSSEKIVPVEHVQTPMELELTKLKDIKPFQVGTQHLYDLADKLPKEMGDQIRNALDTAKINHATHLENSANDLYNKIVNELGIKKGSKESALVQDFGEKTLAKRFLEKINIDPARLTPEQLDEINLQQLQQIRPNDWQRIVEADKYFRENYDNLLNQVNKVRKEIYPTNPEKIVPKRQDYYHHFNELNGLEGLKNIFDSPANIDPSLEGISPYTKPRSKWQGFMQRRGLGPYKSDAVGGYLNYLKASSHSIHVDPVIRVLRNAANTIVNATEHTKNANKMIQALQMHANDLAGKTSEYDRMAQLVIGRKGMKIISNLNARVKSNMILGNLGSTLGQLGNLPLGIAKAKFHSVPGAMDTFGQLANWITRGEKTDPIYQSNFIKERFVTGDFRKFDSKLLDKPKNAAVWLLETADKAQTSLIWHAMYRKGVSKSVADPIKFADYETRKIIAGRGVGEVPLLQKAKTTQLFTPFTLEVANQWKVLRDMVGEKDAGGIITFLVASAAINAGMEKVKGSEASYDPIGALIDGYAKTDGNTAQKVLGALASLNGETIGNIPGGNYLPQVMGLVNDKQKQAIFGDRSPDRFGTGLGVASTIFKPATDAFTGNIGQAGKDLLPLILPYGGNQIKKTYGGIQALAKGGAYNSQDRLQYPIDSSNPADVLHSLMFGPTTTASGQDYYNNKRQPLSVKQTSQVQNSSNPKETYNMVREKGNIKSIQKKIDSVKKDRRLSPQAKQAMIQRLMNQLPAK